jgi:ribosomal protein L13
MSLIKQKFSDLPFRLIIEIINFQEFHFTSKKFKDYDYFGIFEKDRSRKIFQIYQNIFIVERPITKMLPKKILRLKLFFIEKLDFWKM